MFCDKCGNRLRDGAKFCNKCGAVVNESVQLNETPAAGKEPFAVGKPALKNRKKPIMVTVCIGVGVILVAGIVLFALGVFSPKEAKKASFVTSETTSDKEANIGGKNDEVSTEEPTEPPKAEDFIKIYQQDTYYNKIRRKDCTYTMPLIAIDSADAEQINGELIQFYDEALMHINSYINDPYCDGIYEVNYEVWLHDNTLSLCVEAKLAVSARYPVYNIDISTGKMLDNEAVAQYCGKSFRDIFENVRGSMDEVFMEKFGQNGADILEKYREQTMSDENVERSKLYIGDNDQLYVSFEWFMAVQAGQGNAVATVKL